MTRAKSLRLGQRQDGFTLIELLIVIVILGILAAIVVFAVGGISDRGVSAACKTDYKSIEVAAEAYRAKEGTYAGTINLLVPDYIREEPSSAEYDLVYASSGGTFTITVFSPSGSDLGDDISDCNDL